MNCPKCKSGVLINTKRIVTSYPLKYLHKCSICPYEVIKNGSTS